LKQQLKSQRKAKRSILQCVGKEPWTIEANVTKVLSISTKTVSESSTGYTHYTLRKVSFSVKYFLRAFNILELKSQL